ncbi:MAG: 50S ribosome-binding GTPase [Myxococcales bacterium]|nr:50S ribosome-binding GTPase [Myxococcales bacterium]
MPAQGPDDDTTEDERRTLKAIAENIKRIEEMLQFLPLHGDTVKDLRAKIGLLRTVMLEQRPPAFALVGRRGAGKSSMVNALFGAKVAEVGHVKAQTGRGKWFDHAGERGKLSVLDTRGIQEGSTPSEADDAKDAMASILVELRKKPPDVVVFLVKATEVDSAIDADLDALERIHAEIEREHHFRPPLVAILTHCDLLEPKAVRLHAQREETNQEDVAEKLLHVVEAERHLETKLKERKPLADHLKWVRGVCTYLSFRDDGTVRADERWRVDELTTTLFKHLPDAGRGTFARIARVRGLQEELATNMTRATATLCAGVAALPLPVADLIPITSLQIALVASIGWLGGRRMDLKAAGEFLAALGVNVGAAFVLREGARALIKFVFPAGGVMISGAIAFAGTLAIGAAARAYFLRGATIEEAREAYKKTRAENTPAGAEAEDAPPPPAPSEPSNGAG